MASRWRRAGAETGALVVVLALLAGVGVAFAAPWTQVPAPGGDLIRYYPLEDGQAWAQLRTDAGGESLQTLNIRRVPVLTALAQWDDASADALRAVLRGDDSGDTGPAAELDDVALLARHGDAVAIEVHQATVLPDGSVERLVAHQVRDDRGDRLAAISFPAERTTLVYDPAVPVAPADLRPGTTWSADGTFGAATYTFSGEVVAATDDAHADCVRVESTQTLTVDGTEEVTHFADTLCADAASGLVRSESTSADGATTSSAVVVADDGGLLPPAAGAQAPVATAALPPGPDGDPTGWALARWGRAGTTLSLSEPSARPVVVVPPDGEPLVVVTTTDGLVAFAADAPDTVLWRFHPRGVAFGAPVADDAGDLYLGTTGRRVYKLGPDGRLHWVHATGDNVAARPAVADGVVVVAGEDRRLQALDAATGRVRWTHLASGPLVASPVVVDDVVVAGSDSGAVTGHDLGTGEVVWEHDAGGPVEAALVAHPADGAERVLVTTSGGTRLALDPLTGEELWNRDTGVEQRTGPVVAGDAMLLVDASGGWLAAYDAATGEHRWTSEAHGLVGPAAAVGDVAVAVDEAGVVHAFDLADGAPVHRWDPAEGGVVADGPTTLDHGLGVGAGALWTVDDGLVLRRLSLPVAGAATDLVPAWLAGLEGEGLGTLDSTPTAWRDQALVLDHSRGVHVVDPATGEVTTLGTLPGEGFAATGPVVAGDVVVASGADGLTAASLPDLAHRWTVPLDGTVLQPPVVDAAAGVLVVTVSGESGSDGVTPTRVVALSLVDGAELWSDDVDVAFTAGAALRGSAVHVGLRTYDLLTGAVLAEAALPEPWAAALTGGGTAADAELVVASVIDPAVQEGTLVALDAGGAVRWVADEPLLTDITGRPWLTPEVVVTATVEGEVVGLDRRDGTRAWTWEPPSAPLLGGITVDGDLVWVTTSDAHVHVLDAATGRVRAAFTVLELALESMGVAQAPARVGDVVVVPLGLALIGLPAEPADGE